MTVYSGVNMKLAVGGSTVSEQQDATLTLTSSPIGATTKDDACVYKSLNNTRMWEMTASGLAEEGDTGYDAIWTAWNAGTTLSCVMTMADNSTTYTGTARITNYSRNGPVEGAYTFNLSLQGTGTLVKA